MAIFSSLFVKFKNARAILLLIAALFFAAHAMAQDVKVRGHFNSDSTQVGKPIYFTLTARYPFQQTVLFPDSMYSFKPFEWVSKKYTVTETKNGISFDSVTYVLNTYEIDSVQLLKLPVFVVQAKDCTQVFSDTDTVFLKKFVQFVPDSLSIDKLPLKVNTSYLPVGWQLNYVIGGIILAVVLLLLIGVWIAFGKKIRRHFALKRLTKNYTLFLEKFDHAVDQLGRDFTPSAAEDTLVIWKRYLEQLVAKPYTKYTSKEIREMEKNDTLGAALSSIDRMIYANVHESTTPFHNLKEHVYQEFEKKKNELMHG
jgi:hypothetical protein